jgi:hypothetical protein
VKMDVEFRFGYWLVDERELGVESVREKRGL